MAMLGRGDTLRSVGGKLYILERISNYLLRSDKARVEKELIERAGFKLRDYLERKAPACVGCKHLSVRTHTEVVYMVAEHEYRFVAECGIPHSHCIAIKVVPKYDEHVVSEAFHRMYGGLTSTKDAMGAASSTVATSTVTVADLDTSLRRLRGINDDPPLQPESKDVPKTKSCDPAW